jgi:hypothetical protein
VRYLPYWYYTGTIPWSDGSAAGSVPKSSDNTLKKHAICTLAYISPWLI